jgi:hypothetical protein
MDPCIHVVLIIGGSIYGVSTLNEYYISSYPFIIFIFIKSYHFILLQMCRTSVWKSMNGFVGRMQ